MSLENNMITVSHLTETISITKVGVFIWNLETNHVIYSKEWAEIVGYEQQELVPHVSTWESMLFQSDLSIAEESVEKYLAGETPLYEAQFRMTKKDGSIIWGHDKGKVTEYTADGKPLILCGVLQDITNIKLTEQMLRESTDILNLAIEVAEFGTWDWDLEKDIITYNDEYLKMLGYTQDEIVGSLAEWEAMNHPEDLIMVSQLLDDFVNGLSDKYECEVRMRHKDGHYIWTKDVGRIISKDENGIATRVIGGHLNIDSLKTSQSQLEDTLKELENHQTHLENEIEIRTKTLIEQDQLLMAINDVSQKLLAVNETDDFDRLFTECLKHLTDAFDTSEFSFWRYIKIDEGEFFYLSHMYRREFDEHIVLDVKNIEDYIKNLLSTDEGFLIHASEEGHVIVNYNLVSDELRYSFENKKAISDFIADMTSEWAEDIQTKIENSDSSIASSIFLYNDLFGMIATGSKGGDAKYTESHESMLDISGKLFANAQKKHKMDEQLRYAHEEALLSSQAKSNFLANMSHEIRTPLNAILGMSEIVLRESMGRNTEEYAVEIKKASESLLVIINDILDISKIESGKLEVINVEYNITSLLNDIISLSKMRLEERPVILTTFIQSDIPAVMYGDEIRLKQILLNLMGNAIKFTKAGNINLNVNCELHNGKAELIFSVSDTGMGIKESDMDRLFMQFERVDTKKNRNIEGTGLGLAITKQLCEMMDGSISVISEAGAGSVFTVSIPQKYKQLTPITSKVSDMKVLLYEAREVYARSLEQTITDLDAACTICVNQSELIQALSEESFDYLLAPVVHLNKIKNMCLQMNIDINIVSLSDPGDLTIYPDDMVVNLPISCIQMAQIFGNADFGMGEKEKIYSFIAPTAKVLVVDDNNVNLKVARGLMAPFKVDLDTAANGALAVEMIKNIKYDLVFMDHMMPEMDGIDATAAVRKLEGDYFKNLPIIALTANALVGAKELFVREGMNDFLAKPVEIKKLNEILQKWLPKEKQESEIAAETAKVEYDLAIDGINTNYGIGIIGGKIEDYYDLLNTFYNDGLTLIDKLSALDLEQDIHAYKIEVHALKSAAGSIGAFSIAKEASFLEEASIKLDFPYLREHSKAFIASFTKLLSSIELHLREQNEKPNAEKEKGSAVLLKENLSKIDDALNSLDIDGLEQYSEECLSYNWEGQIDELLLNLKRLIDSFEYYEARPVLNELKNEMLLQYGTHSI